MKTSWPDPPPLFPLADLDGPGERVSWLPRPAKRSSSGRRPVPSHVAQIDFEELRMVFDDITAQFEPAEGRLLTNVAVFDLETTGVDVTSDRIVTAYVGVLDGAGNVVEAHDWLADPGIEIPEGAARVHGISTERARAEGRDACEVVDEIVSAVRALLAAGIPVVAYNAAFDLSLLKHEALRHGIAPIENPSPVVDPLVIDKQMDRYRRGKRTLDIVAAHYGVALEDAHEASADAIAAGRIALAQAERYGGDLPSNVAQLHDAQAGWAAEQSASLTQYFVKIGKLSAGETLDGAWPIR